MGTLAAAEARECIAPSRGGGRLCAVRDPGWSSWFGLTEPGFGIVPTKKVTHPLG